MNKFCAIYNVTSDYPDEAIDLQASDLVDYIQTYNPTKLVFKEGMKAVKFNIKRLSVEELSAVASRSKTNGPDVANILAISYGLMSIEAADGEMFTPELTTSKIQQKEISYHKDPAAVTTHLVETYGYDILVELSSAIMKVSKMPLALSPFLRK
jgi:hypothetical protein